MVLLHQAKHIEKYVWLGRKVELLVWVSLDGSKSKLTLIGDQVRQNRFLFWFVEQDMGRLILGCDLDGRTSSKLRIASQDHLLATSSLHTLDGLFLKSLQIQGKSSKPANRGQKSILSGGEANR